VIVGPEVQSGHPFLLFGSRGDHNDWNAARARVDSQPPTQLPPIQSRQHKIEQNQGRLQPYRFPKAHDTIKRHNRYEMLHGQSHA
jgi:hypothetical protein